MVFLITGGQRSGKSNYAQNLALRLSAFPTYVATARVWDNELKQRVNVHKAQRASGWENLEIEKHLSKTEFSGKTVLIDCITLWITNFFFDNEENLEQSEREIKDEIDALLTQSADFIFVTNEIGMGLHGESKTSRKFTDLQGIVNQYIAAKANEVTFLVSGIPVKIK